LLPNALCQASLECARLSELLKAFLLDANSDPQKQLIEEQSRRLFVLQVQHRQLSRRHNSVVAESEELSKREQLLSVHMASMQRVLYTRVGELEDARAAADSRATVNSATALVTFIYVLFCVAL
jgi:hypothetical protein